MAARHRTVVKSGNGSHALGFNLKGAARVVEARMSEDYRHKEAECRHWAQATDDVVLKMNLLEMADTWKIMAESAEKIATTPHPRFRLSARRI